MRRMFSRKGSKQKNATTSSPSEGNTGQNTPGGNNEPSTSQSVPTRPTQTVVNIAGQTTHKPIPVKETKEHTTKHGKAIETKVYGPIGPGLKVDIAIPGSGSRRDLNVALDGRSPTGTPSKSPYLQQLLTTEVDPIWKGIPWTPSTQGIGQPHSQTALPTTQRGVDPQSGQRTPTGTGTQPSASVAGTHKVPSQGTLPKPDARVDPRTGQVIGTAGVSQPPNYGTDARSQLPSTGKGVRPDSQLTPSAGTRTQPSPQGPGVPTQQPGTHTGPGAVLPSQHSQGPGGNLKQPVAQSGGVLLPLQALEGSQQKPGAAPGPGGVLSPQGAAGSQQKPGTQLGRTAPGSVGPSQQAGTPLTGVLLPQGPGGVQQKPAAPASGTIPPQGGKQQTGVPLGGTLPQGAEGVQQAGIPLHGTLPTTQGPGGLQQKPGAPISGTLPLQEPGGLQQTGVPLGRTFPPQGPGEFQRTGGELSGTLSPQGPGGQQQTGVTFGGTLPPQGPAGLPQKPGAPISGVLPPQGPGGLQQKEGAPLSGTAPTSGGPLQQPGASLRGVLPSPQLTRGTVPNSGTPISGTAPSAQGPGARMQGTGAPGGAQPNPGTRGSLQQSGAPLVGERPSLQSPQMAGGLRQIEGTSVGGAFPQQGTGVALQKPIGPSGGGVTSIQGTGGSGTFQKQGTGMGNVPPSHDTGGTPLTQADAEGGTDVEVLMKFGDPRRVDPSLGPQTVAKTGTEKEKSLHPEAGGKGDTKPDKDEVVVLMESKSVIQQRENDRSRDQKGPGAVVPVPDSTRASQAQSPRQSKGDGEVEVLMKFGDPKRVDPSSSAQTVDKAGPEKGRMRQPEAGGKGDTKVDDDEDLEVEILMESKSVIQQRENDRSRDQKGQGEAGVTGDPKQIEVLMESRSVIQQRERDLAPDQKGQGAGTQETGYWYWTSKPSPEGKGFQSKPEAEKGQTLPRDAGGEGDTKVEVLMESKSVIQQRENDRGRDQKGRRVVPSEAPLQTIVRKEVDGKRVETKVFGPLTSKNKGIKIEVVKPSPRLPPPPIPKPKPPPPPPPPPPEPERKPSLEVFPRHTAKSVALLDYLDHLKDLSEADLEHEESPDETEEGGNVAIQALKKFGLPEQGKALDNLLNTDSVHFDFGGLMRQYYSFVLRSYCLINMQDRYRGCNHSSPCFQAVDLTRIGSREEEQEKVTLGKQRKLDDQREGFRKVAKDEDHFQYLNALADNVPTLLPLTIIHMMNEQLCPVLEDVFRFYGKNLGTEHKCTKEAGFHYMKVRKRCEMYSNICGGSTLEEDLLPFYNK